jgi:cyclase
VSERTSLPSSPGAGRPEVAIAATGAANLASVLAGFARAGAEARLVAAPKEILDAEFAVLPGVGAFGPAMAKLAAGGFDRAFVERVRSGRPTLGICLGMQLFCASSEEAPGVAGLGIVGAGVRRFDDGLALPQLGWNRLTCESDGPSCLSPGWAYFANSFRLAEVPPGFRAWKARYGEDFVAALEGLGPGREGLLLCQFHPELSGPWGLRLLRRWLGLEPRSELIGADTTGSRMPVPGGTALRIIPCLDLKDGRVVKGRKFVDLTDAGDPVELACRYEAEGADELALLDITATIEGRDSSLEALRRVRARLGIPLVMGGGIRREEDAAALLDAGADRVAINSAAVADPDLIDRLARRFGVQCVVLAIDARRVVEDRAPGAAGGPRWEVVVEAGRRVTGLEASAWAAEGARRGAGEILLTSIDRDGTGEGFDLELLRRVSKASGIPVIASGGAAGGAEGLRHFEEAARAGVRALLAAGAFHRGELSIGEVHAHLEKTTGGIRS